MKKAHYILILSNFLFLFSTHAILLQKKPSSGAGILIYTYRNNEPYILLGQRNDNKQWGDFGGTYEETDYDKKNHRWMATWAAAREGAEELALLLDAKSHLQSLVTEALRNKVPLNIKRSRTYALLLAQIQNYGIQLGSSNFMITAMPEMAAIDNAQFITHQQLLISKIQKSAQALKVGLYHLNGFLEMDAIAWIPAKQLINGIRKTRRNNVVKVYGKILDKKFVHRMRKSLPIIERVISIPT